MDGHEVTALPLSTMKMANIAVMCKQTEKIVCANHSVSKLSELTSICSTFDHLHNKQSFLLIFWCSPHEIAHFQVTLNAD